MYRKAPNDCRNWSRTAGSRERPGAKWNLANRNVGQPGWLPLTFRLAWSYSTVFAIRKPKKLNLWMARPWSENSELSSRNVDR